MKCPNCEGLTEPDGLSCSCGWRAKPIEIRNQPRLCAFNDHGYSCHLPGHLSTSTNGTGPWFCRTHFAQIMHWPEQSKTLKKPLSIAIEEITKGLKEPYKSKALNRQAVSWQPKEKELEPMSEVDKRVNKLVPRLEGESEHAWSMRCRDWVLDKIRHRSVLRQPGED